MKKSYHDDSSGDHDTNGQPKLILQLSADYWVETLHKYFNHKQCTSILLKAKYK